MNFSHFLSVMMGIMGNIVQIEMGIHKHKNRPKWPISINCRNIWPNSTVCEIISHLPFFGVLELTELEYPIFFCPPWHLTLASEIFKK